jgi:hypothetical protein
MDMAGGARGLMGDAAILGLPAMPANEAVRACLCGFRLWIELAVFRFAHNPKPPT